MCKHITVNICYISRGVVVRNVLDIKNDLQESRSLKVIGIGGI